MSRIAVILNLGGNIPSGRYSYEDLRTACERSAQDGKTVFEYFLRGDVPPTAGIEDYFTGAKVWQGQDGYDLYFYVDERVKLRDGVVTEFLGNVEFFKEAILTAQARYEGTREVTAGGFSRSGRPVFPDSVLPVPCYSFTDDILMVMSSVRKKIGLPDDCRSVEEYAKNAKKSGIPRVVIPGEMSTTGRRHIKKQKFWFKFLGYFRNLRAQLGGEYGE